MVFISSWFCVTFNLRVCVCDILVWWWTGRSGAEESESTIRIRCDDDGLDRIILHSYSVVAVCSVYASCVSPCLSAYRYQSHSDTARAAACSNKILVDRYR